MQCSSAVHGDWRACGLCGDGFSACLIVSNSHFKVLAVSFLYEESVSQAQPNLHFFHSSLNHLN